MNIPRILFIAAMIVLSVCGSAYPLSIAPENLDLGNVQKNSSQKRYFLLSNDTGKTIQIVDAINNCGLEITLGEKTLAPGQKREATVLFSAGRAQGAFREKISFMYRFEGSDTIHVKDVMVTWFTYPEKYAEMDISPTTIDLGEVPVGKDVFFKLTIRNKGNIRGEINTEKIVQGVYLPFPVVLEPQETKYIKGSIRETKPGVYEKDIALTTTEIGREKPRLTIRYSAVPCKNDGVSIEFGELVQKKEASVLPVIIESGKYDIHIVSVSDPGGKNLPTAEKLPVFLKKRGRTTLHLEVDKDAYRRLQASYLYFTIGMLGEE